MAIQTPRGVPAGMGVEDLVGYGPPDAKLMPPSIEELFKQGNVQVSPGPPGAPRTAGNVPPTALQSGYSGLANLNEMLDMAGKSMQTPETFTSPEPGGLKSSGAVGPASYYQATSIGDEYAKRLDTERLLQQKMEMEAGTPGRQAQANIAEARGKQPLEMEQIQEKGRVTQAGELAKIQAMSEARSKELLEMPFQSGPLQGRTLGELNAMRPEQKQALLASYLGAQHIKDFGSLITALSGFNVSPEAKEQYLLLGMSLFMPPGTDLRKFVTMSTGKDGKPIMIVNVAQGLGLIPTTAGTQIGPAKGPGLLERGIGALGGMFSPAQPGGPLPGPPGAAEQPIQEQSPPSGLSDFLTRPPMGPGAKPYQMGR